MRLLPHVPILRRGEPYESVEKVVLVHHETGAPVASVSQANSGMIVRDARRMDDGVLESIPTPELLAICRRAADLFLNAELPLGDGRQTFSDYARQLSGTTGMPVAYVRNNAVKIHRVLAEMETILGGLSRGLDLTILDRGYGRGASGTVSFHRVGRLFGAVLPSNSPGVHSLWVPAIALKTPVMLKPGREEPWTPYRIIESFRAAGVPRSAFGFYPTDHAGAGELLRCTDRSMLFGDTGTTRPWMDDPRVQVHGPGFSKILLGQDCADDWAQYLDVMVRSITANAGRSCINASGVWTPRHGREIAEALAERLAAMEVRPAEDPLAELAAFANPRVAEGVSALIDRDLGAGGAEDVTQRVRGGPRLVRRERCAYLLPTIIHCTVRDHPLANREFLFPYATVVECPSEEMPEAVGPTLVVSAITRDRAWSERLMASGNVDRLNLGAIATCDISWDQPHEGNLFEHLYRQRAFQVESAA